MEYWRIIQFTIRSEIMVDYISDKCKISITLLTEFIKSVDKDFTPPLTGRVNIEEWIDKIYSKGSIILAESESKYIGCILFYSNDIMNRKGYIAYLAVDSKYRRLGIAKSMLDRCVDISRNNNMLSITVYTNNPGALKLYESGGFQIEAQEEIEKYGVIQTLLNKQL